MKELKVLVVDPVGLHARPATIAVKIPASGPTPDASASAIDSGNAIIATMIPAVTSLMN